MTVAELIADLQKEDPGRAVIAAPVLDAPVVRSEEVPRRKTTELSEAQWKGLMRWADQYRDETQRFLDKISLTTEQHAWVAQGVDKRCRILIAPSGSEVQWDADQVRVEPGGSAPLPEGYRVRESCVAGKNNTLPFGHTGYKVQHKSFLWIEEGERYPEIELVQQPSARTAGAGTRANSPG